MAVCANKTLFTNTSRGPWSADPCSEHWTGDSSGSLQLWGARILQLENLGISWVIQMEFVDCLLFIWLCQVGLSCGLRDLLP